MSEECERMRRVVCGDTSQTAIRILPVQQGTRLD